MLYLIYSKPFISFKYLIKLIMFAIMFKVILSILECKINFNRDNILQCSFALPSIPFFTGIASLS